MTQNDLKFFKSLAFLIATAAIYAVLTHYQLFLVLWVAKGLKMALLAFMGWHLALMSYHAVNQLKETITVLKKWHDRNK